MPFALKYSVSLQLLCGVRNVTSQYKKNAPANLQRHNVCINRDSNILRRKPCAPIRVRDGVFEWGIATYHGSLIENSSEAECRLGLVARLLRSVVVILASIVEIEKILQTLCFNTRADLWTDILDDVGQKLCGVLYIPSPLIPVPAMNKDVDSEFAMCRSLRRVRVYTVRDQGWDAGDGDGSFHAGIDAYVLEVGVLKEVAQSVS
jgi:hypothetical protein